MSIFGNFAPFGSRMAPNRGRERETATPYLGFRQASLPAQLGMGYGGQAQQSPQAISSAVTQAVPQFTPQPLYIGNPNDRMIRPGFRSRGPM